MSRGDAGEPPAVPAVREPAPLPTAFWAFHHLYFRVYRRYAELHLGDKRLAGEIVHEVFMALLYDWGRLMEEASPTSSAWAFFKSVVAEELAWQGRESAMPETATFDRVALTRDLLDSFRNKFAVMESSLGLYAAIARLPERQFDVMVLVYVLGYDLKKTAQTMGVSAATVRSHRDRARQRIARDLENPPPDEQE
ncbi:RNA polymerase sigma factor [Actinacidiphila glaucinigra]|uniref:RNA polymerase sigma-70 factor, ECF subfamily n=1 Tax=Actinacidiphila glaucinigra TaxID=235986 RepID=A0A239NU89_9ACTN|nr:sigma-70 family RNA polymerase sigma factor [Actinacidiphila glaucinigra]SNT58405.1 RNA polymerase sigma-70 factor, ECF subfamily [Actinacidiphila glaucinigra]